MPHKEVSLQEATAVQERYAAELMKKENVVGVGIGLRRVGGRPTDQVCIVVMVKDKVPLHTLSPKDRVPQMLDGVPVDVQETGEFSAGG